MQLSEHQDLYVTKVSHTYTVCLITTYHSHCCTNSYKRWGNECFGLPSGMGPV